MKKRYFLQWQHSVSDNLKSKSGPADKNPKCVGLVALAVTYVLCGGVALAQQPKKVARACYIGNTVTGTAENIKPFQQRLRELGYVEGQNLTIDYRYFEGQMERLQNLAAEFVRLNCDVIVTQGTEAAKAAKNSTKTIPVVMAFSGDAVKRGIVADLARPGGNITGLTDMGAEMYGKRLELLKETVPKLARVAFLWYPTDSDAEYNVKETEPVAKFLRVGIQSLEVKRPNDIDGAFRAATKGRANGLMVAAGGFLLFTESGS